MDTPVLPISSLHSNSFLNATFENYYQFVFGYHLDTIDEFSGYAVIVVDRMIL